MDNDASELNWRVRRKLSNLEAFRDDQKELWTIMSAMYRIVEASIKTVVMADSNSGIEAHRVMMWYTLRDYQVESLFLILDRKLNEGWALLRLAAELARDVARIGDDLTQLELWLKRSDKSRRKSYRDSFRFNDADEMERHVHMLYQIASTLGVHGHVKTSASLRPSWAEGEYVALEVSDLEVLKSIEFWFAAFFPLQELCVRTFRVTGRIPTELNDLYFGVWRAFDGVYKVFRESLKSMDADADLLTDRQIEVQEDSD